VAARTLTLGLLFLTAALLVSLAPASADGPIYATIIGPPATAVNAVTFYNVTINGGPTGSVNYTLHWYITGSNLTGGRPVLPSPATTSGTATTLKLNITAPSNEQTITLFVSVSAASRGTFENTTAELSIAVVTPIVLSATFQNDGPTAAINVTVRFLVDGVLVGTKNVSRIDASKQATVTFNYLPTSLQPGTHTVRIEADLDGNGIIDPARGEVVTSQLFYKGTPGLSTGWTVLIGIAVFLPIMFLTVAVRRRGKA
jgi:hypothetical protein